jgi:phosphoribosyl 1,2-cyclic phosphodiesterase
VRVFVLNSGSSGNVTVVEHEGARLIIDAGLSKTLAAERMRSLGLELLPQGALGIFITHQHRDHMGKLVPLANALGTAVFLHEATPPPESKSKLNIRPYTPGIPLRIGPFVVESLAIPHDIPNVAIRVEAGGLAFGIATDLGHATPDLVYFLARCDAALIEANHCPRMLDTGPYPDTLKARVRGPYGHFANEQAADLVARLVGTRMARVVLGHISNENNTPQRALEVVRAAAPILPIEAIADGEARVFEVKPGIAMQFWGY